MCALLNWGFLRARHANAQQTQEQPQQLSSLELSLRWVEQTAGIRNQKGDVALTGDRKHGIRKDKRTWERWFWRGRSGVKTIARLTKEERRGTRSDARRIDVKARLCATAKKLAKDREVKRDEQLRLIVEQIRAYSEQDVTAVEGEALTRAESEAYRSICESLDDYIQNAKYGSSTKRANVALRFQAFFLLHRDGNLEIPTDPDKLIRDDLRPPMLTKEVGHNKFEDYDTASQLSEVKMKDDEPLFPHEPSVNDIRQGQLGNCYFLAALCSIVNQNPQSIKDCMKDAGDGFVYVRFYKKGQDGSFSPVYVKTKKVVVRNNADGQDTFAHGSLWVQMMERAYAIACVKLNVSGIGRHQYRRQPGNTTEGMRKALHARIARELERDKNDPQKLKTTLDSYRYKTESAFMFDGSGRFIENYDDIAEEAERPSYLDTAGGSSAAVFERIMGKPAEYHTARRDDNWLYNSFMDRMYAEQGTARSQPTGDLTTEDMMAQTNADRTVFMNALRTAVTADPRLSQIPSAPGALDAMLQSSYPLLDTAFKMIIMTVRESAPKTREEVRLAVQTAVTEEFKTHLDAAQNSRLTLLNLIMLKVHDITNELLGGMMNKFQVLKPGEYDEDEETMYDRIKTGIAQNKLISAGTIDMQGTGNAAGLNREPIANGVVGEHAFTVLGVEERKMHLGPQQEYNCKFIKLRNPWGDSAMIHEVENGVVRTRNADTGAKGKQGVFLMELKSFMKYFDDVWIQ